MIYLRAPKNRRVASLIYHTDQKHKNKKRTKNKKTTLLRSYGPDDSPLRQSWGMMRFRWEGFVKQIHWVGCQRHDFENLRGWSHVRP